MDPADCSALEFEAEMERLVKLLDGIPQSDSLQVMSEELRALEAIVKINPQIQQFATNTILVRTIAAWGGARQGNFTWSLSLSPRRCNRSSLISGRYNRTEFLRRCLRIPLPPHTRWDLVHLPIRRPPS